MEPLKELLPSTEPRPTSKELEAKCRKANAQRIWSVTSKLIAEIVLQGTSKDADKDLDAKQKMLCEKLADRNPDHVAEALKAHQENKPWFPHISDLMPKINELERSERAKAEAAAKRDKAWYSGKDDDDFVEPPLETRQAGAAAWRNRYRGELLSDAEAAEDADLSPDALARKKARENRQHWRDPQNDPPESIARLKKSMGMTNACSSQQAT